MILVLKTCIRSTKYEGIKGFVVLFVNEELYIAYVWVSLFFWVTMLLRRGISKVHSMTQTGGGSLSCLGLTCGINGFK